MGGIDTSCPGERPGPACSATAAHSPTPRARRARLRESPLARLTPRELDVLREMAQGPGNTGIARQLSLSESSVEKHVNSIFAKLGLGNEPQVHRRVAAVLAFLRDAGLRPPAG